MREGGREGGRERERVGGGSSTSVLSLSCYRTDLVCSVFQPQDKCPVRRNC